jgi:elongation factor G
MIEPVAYPEPIYRVAIKPATKADEDKLGTALSRLREEDPTFRNLRDAATHQEILEGMGDIHLDTVIEKLKSKFGVNVTIEEARVPYRETVRSSAKAQGRHKRQTGGKGQFGDCWIELEPLERGGGFAFENKVVGGAIPKNFIPAIEKGIVEAMERGLVAGYQVQDIKVTVYDGSYHDVDSSEMAFKTAGAIALRNAAEKAQATILEPMLDVQVDVPDDTVGDVVGDLNGRRGRLAGMDPISPGKTRINATVPMATMMRYALDLRSITKGRGRFRQTIATYEELPHPEQQKLVEEYAKQRAAHESEH